MTGIIRSLLDDYEEGTMSRRQLVEALAVAFVPASVSGTQGAAHADGMSQNQRGVLRGVNINHVNLQVSDLDRSIQFYRRLFSLPPKRPVPGRPDALDLADGLSFLSVPQREPTGVIDHFCVGVQDFEPERVGSVLREAGLDRDLQVAEDFVMVRDPDDIRVQISWPNWGG